MENKRKKRLLELKDDVQQKSHAENSQTDSAVASETEGDDLNRFIKGVLEQKKSRKQQLEIVQDFFENPTAYGVDTDIIPSSTTKVEIDSRKKELQHRINLLRSVLKAFEGELQLLCQIKTPDENDNNHENSRSSKTQQTILEKKAAANKKPPHERANHKKAARKKSARASRQTTPSTKTGQ